MTATGTALQFLPLGIDVRQKSCLVVGGGPVGTRKVTTLVRAGARVTVVAPVITDDLRTLVADGTIRWIEGPYRHSHMEGAFLAVAATNDVRLNATVTADAARAGALACDASSGQASQVIFGALLQRDGTTIAVFTDGRDPAAARRTRDQVAQCIEQDRIEGRS
jgi:siroheme synthase-like protein